MQLGARWAAGSAPHRGVPEALHAEIAAQEARHPDEHSWTLTWLEGRPRCALGDAVVVALDASGGIEVEDEGGADEDDDWLGEL